MRIFLSLFLSLFLFACCHLSTNKATPLTAYKSVGTIVVYIDAPTSLNPKAQRRLATGTVFSISKHKLITADHICRYAQEMEGHLKLEYFSGHYLFRLSEKLIILKQDPDNDLCMLYVNTSVLKPLKISSQNPKMGSKISVFGSPVGQFGVWTNGYVGLPKVKVRVMDGKIYKMTMTALSVLSYGGNSGSPVFDEKGRVMGLISCGNMEYPVIHFSPMYEEFIKFVKE